MPQIVRTNKRVVYATGATVSDIGITASAFCDYGTTDGRQLGQGSGITNGTAAISKIVSGSPSFSVSMSGQIVFTGGAAGEYNFERYTLKPVGINPTGVFGVTVSTAGTVIVEFVL
jgi:hypothetical protein